MFQTKNYVDTNAFTTAGGVVSGDIKLSVGSDLVRSLECIDLSVGRSLHILLGSDKKYAIVFRSKFWITIASQDKN